MSRTPFMPLWVSDFIGDTMDLDAQEVGAYMLLLMAQWQRGGASLPNDEKKLQRIARAGRSWPKVWANIGRYFKIDDNGVYSQRLRLEHENVTSKRIVNSQNGARGGAAKSLKSNNVDLANATVSLQRNPSIPEPEPERVVAAAAREGEITPDQLHAEVMAAVGLTSGHMPTHWMPPAAIIHCQRWVSDLGLTADQIIQAARESRKRHHDPPGGPRALDGVMQRLAATIQAPQLSPAQPNGATNARSERRAFDGAINALANQIADGTVRIDDTSRDPWHYAARGG